ncbi:MAG TPA: S-methyl-5-thioribose-1-phosphate isomerase [Firmicutes bacterium]|nr:S-methyl-5-thioribose-1-phosphate isomerase [Bacillota bacterium]
MKHEDQGGYKTNSLIWQDGKLLLLDQRELPHETRYVECSSPEAVAKAISDMVVRGAPAIGAAAAYGVALGALEACRQESFLDRFLDRIEDAAETLRRSRPTAVNLAWAVERMLRRARSLAGKPPQEIAQALVEEANAIFAEDVRANMEIGRYGAPLVPDRGTILTYCNAGALATAGYGTALGVVRAAQAIGKRVSVIACETRPYLQGARLTTWELQQDGIPVTLITDNAAGYVMKAGLVDMVIVGADRIAANGDVANKIGTYQVAVIAREHSVPFYVAAPTSTIDLETPDGDSIPIEMRSPGEVTHFRGVPIAPEGVAAINPAFDVTPARFIKAIITEVGVLRPPYTSSLRSLQPVKKLREA